MTSLGAAAASVAAVTKKKQRCYQERLDEAGRKGDLVNQKNGMAPRSTCSYKQYDFEYRTAPRRL